MSDSKMGSSWGGGRSQKTYVARHNIYTPTREKQK